MQYLLQPEPTQSLITVVPQAPKCLHSRLITSYACKCEVQTDSIRIFDLASVLEPGHRRH